MRTMNGIRCELAARVRPFLEAEAPQVVVFTVPSAEKGAILEVGKAFAFQGHHPQPLRESSANALGPGVLRGHW